MSSVAPKAAEVAATLEQTTRRLDAYIKVCTGGHACMGGSFVFASPCWTAVVRGCRHSS